MAMAMAMQRQLCSFCPGGKGSGGSNNGGGEYFAIVSNDNRLKVFEATSGVLRHTFMEPNHLATSYTSMAWAPPTVSGKKNGKHNSASKLGCIALGTSAGVVVLWDLAQGKITQRFGEGSSNSNSTVRKGTVTAVAFNADGSILFSCTKGDKFISEWDVRSGTLRRNLKAGKHGSTALAVSPDSSLLAAAGTHIRIIDLSSGKKSLRFSGHQTNVLSMSFSDDSRLLVSTAADRFPSVWNCADISSANEQQKQSLQSFAMSSNPTSIAIKTLSPTASGQRQKKGKGKRNKKAKTATPLRYHVLATSEMGSVNLWSFENDDTKSVKRNITPDCTIVIKAESESKTSVDNAESNIFLASFVRSANSAGEALVQVSCGSTVKPFFERIGYTKNNGNELLSNVAITRDDTHDTNLLVGSKRKAGSSVDVTTSSTKGDVQVLGPAQLGTLNPPKRSRSLSVVSNASSYENIEDVPLAERLAAMADDVEVNIEDLVNPKSLHTAGEQRAAAERASEIQHATQEASLGADKAGRGNGATASSLANVLDQALTTNDDALLEYCLATTDKQVIQSSVKRLSGPKAMQFLSRVIGKFEARPMRAQMLVKWIKAVLEHHTSYLMKRPRYELMNALSGLYQTIDSRLTTYKKILKLSGRLDLLLSQIRYTEESASPASASGPKIVFEEGDDNEQMADDADSEDNEGSDEESDEEDSEEDDEDNSEENVDDSDIGSDFDDE